MNKTIIQKHKLGEEQGDLQFWLTKTPLERLEALEFLRQQLYDNIPQRLQRIYTIIKQKRG